MDANVTIVTVILAALAVFHRSFLAWLDKRPPRPHRDRAPKKTRSLL